VTGARQSSTLPAAPATFLNAVGPDVLETTKTHPYHNFLFDKLIVRGSTDAFVTSKISCPIFSDMLLLNYFNYGLSPAPGRSDLFLTAVVTQQGATTQDPLPMGDAVAPNRNSWNTVLFNNVSVPVPNKPRHTSFRCANVYGLDMQLCSFDSTGGHGDLHQPLSRINVNGNPSNLPGGTTTLEEERAADKVSRQGAGFNIQNCLFNRGLAQINLTGLTDKGFITASPFVLIEGCHFRMGSTNSGNLYQVINTYRPGTKLRNCLFEYADGESHDLMDPILIEDVSGNDALYGQLRYQDGPLPEGPQPFEIENCTFVYRSTISPARAITLLPGLRYGQSITYRNCVWIIENTGQFSSIDAAILALNESVSDFDADYRPLAAAAAYQDASGSIPVFDASGAVRPSSNASRGWLEPT